MTMSPSGSAPLDPRNGFGVTALVLGIIAVIFSFIPLVGIVSFFVGGLAVIFGIIGLTRKNRAKGLSVAGLILGAVGIIIAGIVTATTAAFVSSVDEEMNKEATVVYKATSENNATVMFGATSGTSNEDFKGKWEQETTVTGWDATSLIVTSGDYTTSQKVSCEIIIDGESVAKQSGTDNVSCTADTISK
ncbi:DUF4190 domain-containing protein [Glutamicibacter halophytocola]|uniref:DUF4190 domain-containing protein n=1 Tax=Glutamicibacter halophytocola TaxID=1933880 RepID=UPI0015C528F5|nr:DUF4190 domain-containing protein [Glutamicibacter halophytocola]NQD42411.1 DUF4190 domain-containing protein [Glutamicibacter halophytocola]